MKSPIVLVLIALVLAACQPANPAAAPGVNPAVGTAVNNAVGTALPDVREVPSFDHVVLILLENRSFQDVIGTGSAMPHLNELAHRYVLLNNYYAVAHPSLPNYLALISGTTADIKSDCTSCFVNQPSIADLLDASGKTWKTYQEDMPSPCFVGDAKPYYQKHNPFVYFDSIRLNSSRCDQSVVPLTQLDTDLAKNQLPNFSFIMPNYCNSGHACPASTADNWVSTMVNKLQASQALGRRSLIIITFDEGAEASHGTCCGATGSGGGQVATILISPLAKPGFVDNTGYSHYSLLKTILAAWKLADIGNTAPSSTPLILAPWLPGTG